MERVELNRTIAKDKRCDGCGKSFNYLVTIQIDYIYAQNGKLYCVDCKKKEESTK